MIVINERAKIGGEYGINGEYYDGGQFLPSSPRTIKGENKSSKSKSSNFKKAHKQEIALYKWETSTKKSIWTTSIYCLFTKIGYTKEEGSIGTLKVRDCVYENDTGFYNASLVATIERNTKAWNDGIRWEEDAPQIKIFELNNENSFVSFYIYNDTPIVEYNNNTNPIRWVKLNLDGAREEYKKYINMGYTLIKNEE